MNDKEELKIIEEYRSGKSSGQIAKEYNTYSTKIIRILNKYGEPIRTPSEAQRIALSEGRSQHPTKGKKATDDTKIRQSETQAKRWKDMPVDQKTSLKAGAKDRWEKRSDNSKAEMLSKAGQALQKASKEGSKAEKYINEKLQQAGYLVIMHKKGLIPGDYELDLFLPELNTVIELDGPQHFLPVFGEELLLKNIKYDTIKNGLLINKGIHVIRVKYIIKHLSEKIKRTLLEKILNIIGQIESGTTTNQLIEVELNG